MINVLELIDGGFLGGGQRHVLSLANCLDRKKFLVTVAASPEGEFKKLVEKSGVKFCDIYLPKFYGIKHLKKLHEIVKENNIDIIHSHGGVGGMYSRFYKKKYNRIKVIHTIHGIHYIHSKQLLRKFLSLSMEQFLMPYTDRFICVSHSDYILANKNKIIDTRKSTIIKNGIDILKFAKTVKDNNILSKFNLNPGDFIIGNVSRFDIQKNQMYLISKADYIFTKYPEVKMLFVGNGKYLDVCKAMAEKSLYADRIIFAGEAADVEDYYSLFDIFVFPSLWEGLSISLIEAMASSRCILASNIDANLELIKDNVNGLTFEPANDTEFIKKLEQLFENGSLRHSLSQQAFEDAAKYSEKTMADKIGNEYLKLSSN